MVMNLDTKNLHHAYCIIGDSKTIVANLENIFRDQLGFSTEGNPDFWYAEYDVLDIADSRSLKNLHGNKPTKHERKIFVVNANFITEKAQNAMLKLFEEPRGDTHFFLVLPSLNNIIATLRSRFLIIDTNLAAQTLINVENFLHMGVGERMKEVRRLSDAIADEEKSKIEVMKFLNALEIELKRKTHLSENKLSELNIFEDIEMIRQYASEQSPSLKMLLEHMALILPIFKD